MNHIVLGGDILNKGNHWIIDYIDNLIKRPKSSKGKEDFLVLEKHVLSHLVHVLALLENWLPF